MKTAMEGDRKQHIQLHYFALQSFHRTLGVGVFDHGHHHLAVAERRAVDQYSAQP